MHRYLAFGLGIESDLPLPELIPSSVTPEVHIRIGALGTEEILPHDDPECYLGETEFGRLLVTKRGHIVFEPVPDTDVGLIRAIVLGPALALFLRLRGYFALHASGIVVEKGVVAFAGNTGWGKSTLAKAFHTQGFPLVTDDILAIDMAIHTPMILPSFPLLKLWPDSAIALDEDLSHFTKLHASTQKLARSFTENFQDQRLPLKCIYILGKGDQSSIETLSEQDALTNLIAHSWGTTSLTQKDYVHIHLQQCARIIQEVPVRRLRRPTDLKQVHQSVQLILDNLQQ
jgi:hypothetical protein